MLYGMRVKKVNPLCKAGCGMHVKRSFYTYCSVKCQQRYQYQQRIERFLRGEHPAFAFTGGGFVRRYLMEFHNERCARCGWNERHPVTGLVPLEIEHIDGCWQNARPQNLTLLCPNCHSLTPTFKALNRGKGREMREAWRKPIEESADVA